MKNFIFSLLALSCLVISCGKNNKDLLNPAKDQELLSQHFSAATVGVISANSNLQYVLISPVSQEISEDELQNVIKLNPNVKGKVSLVNHTILTFVPDEPLASNKAYTINIDMKKLDDQRYEDVIVYQIKTLFQDLSVSRDGILIGDDGAQTYLLTVRTADKADTDKLLNCIVTDADNKTITEIGSNEYQVSLVWNQGVKSSSSISYDGKAIGSTSKNDISLYTLKKNTFNVIDFKYNAAKKEYNIYFSQLLRRQMDMTGLITVNDKNAEYTIKDNLLTIFLANVSDKSKVEIKLNTGIRSNEGLALPETQSFTINIEDELPAIQFVNSGHYFPSDGAFKIPVKTRALEKMRLAVIEIKPENVKHYLAWNTMDYTDYYTLRKFGKPVFDEVVLLNQGIKDDDGWMVHGIDLSQKVKRNPGSVYHIAMEFAPEYTTLACKDKLSKYNYSGNIPNMDYFKFKDSYYRDYFYYNEDYDYWEDRKNPCKLGFYYNQYITEGLFICSDYSIIAKKAGNTYHIALSRLNDLSLVANAKVSIYNMQGERIEEKTTDANGFAVFDKIYEDVTIVEVKNHNQITYLTLDAEQSNSLTEFDISGERSEEETAFYIYTDRDIYRPGDSIFVNFMVNNSAIDMPKGLPLAMSFYDLDNMVLDKQIQTLNPDNKLIYSFVLHTQAQAKTGVYRCIFQIGPKKLRKNIRIETIKPNTTEVLYRYDKESNKTIYGDVVSGQIHARYLSGFDLANGYISASAKISKLASPFPGYNNYHFNVYDDDQATNINLYTLTTDAKGRGSFRSDISFKKYGTPVKMYVETETTLPDGGMSKEGSSITISPFNTYVGAVKRNGSGWNGTYNLHENISIDLVSVTDKGTLNGTSSTISYKLQKAVDSWWVEKYRYSALGNYISSATWKDMDHDNTTFTSKGNISLGKSLESGVYLLTMIDNKSNHSTQVYFSIIDQSSRDSGSESFLVDFEIEKESYKTGEDVKLKLPAIKDGKALISIERGSKVLEQKWVNLSNKKSSVELTSKSDWAPNVYIHVTVVQNYLQQDNDMPLRMYGVKYLRMDKSKQSLTPVTDIPATLESNKKYTFNVSEKEGRPMEYTIALVDEGLLGLTGFKTPNPDRHFNGKFPLLVKTWDIYQNLIAWFNGTFAGIISIGGDDAYNPDAIAEINRFKPVVMHLGPYKLGDKGKNNHTITMPNYVGKLRMMIVAVNHDNFGSFEKLIPVKNPIMVQTQLPRSLNVTDKVKLPVSIFRDDKSISAFNLTTKADATFVKGLPASTNLSFNGKDLMTHIINMDVQNKVGHLKLDIGAQAGTKSMTESTDIMVNYPHAYESEGKKHVVEKGKSISLKISPKGYKEVFTSDIIISGIKVPDFTKYADELIQYPYGCLEQITSKGYGMLYLDKVLTLEPKEEKERLNHLQNVLFEVSKLQQDDGKFKYWENGYYDGWADVYVGNFLVEMNSLKQLGMYKDMLDKWLSGQVSLANNWALSNISSSYLYENESLIQAFRLYTLAKANKSAKSGLNRFVTNSEAKNPLTWWLIAGAYQLGGFDTKAKEYMDKAESLQMQDDVNDWNSYSFGSKARDLAVTVEILSYIQPSKKKMDHYYDAMVEACNQTSWASTQTMGFAFIAAYKYFGKSLEVNKKVKYDISGLANGNKSYTHSSFDPKVVRIRSTDWNKIIKITNQGDGQLYIYQNTRFIDNVTEKAENAEGLQLAVEYFNATNNTAGLDGIRLGDDIVISVTVANQLPIDQTHLALNYKVPSGWELINPRLYETNSQTNTNGIQYQDYRDDRVYTFLELKAGGRKTIRFKAKATFSGDFYMPAISFQHMYQADVSAATATGRVRIR